MTIDYAGIPACEELGSTFPLTDEPVDWDDLLFGDATYTSSAVKIRPISLGSEAVAMIAIDVCPLVTSTMEHPNEVRDLLLSPIPATDGSTCEWTQPLSGSAHLELVDAWGRSVLRINEVHGAGRQQARILVAHLARGLYMLRLSVAGTTLSTRTVLR